MYLSVFISAFLAATLLPAQSEAVLAYHLSARPESMEMLIGVATAGNVLGALLNWWLGRFFTHFKDRRWFTVDGKALLRAEQHYKKYGRYSLLLSWVPFIGDPITVIAGFLREPVWSFIILVTIAKCGRYLVVALVVSGIA